MKEDHMSTVTRRRFLQTLAQGGIAAAGGRLTAGASLGLALPAGAQTAQPFAGQSILHWSFLSPEGKSAREVAIKEIEAKFRERTGINVAFQTMPWQELGTRLISAVRAGNPPDNSRVNSFHLKQILKADSLINL